MTAFAETSNRPITIEVNGDIVNIIAYVNITGNAADLTIGGTTYRQAAIDGIIQNWSGDKDGVYVNVEIIEVENNSDQSSLNIRIRNGVGLSRLLGHRRWTPETPGTIVLYQGDERVRTTHRYRLNEFKRMAAHEFGHALGVCDTPRRDIMTIMSPLMWLTSATRLDLELAIQANNDGWQRFEDNLELIETYGTPWAWIR